MRGRALCSPAPRIRYLPQEPDLSGFATVARLCRCRTWATATIRNRATYLLGKLGLTGAERPCDLSGGEARRAALARVLAPAPDILLLDEPTNHLDLPAIEWLESELAAMRSALVLISHDRRFLRRSFARHGLARPRPHAASGTRLRTFRSLAGRSPGAGRTSSATSSTARSRWKRIGCAMASARGANAIRAGWRGCAELRTRAPRAAAR